MNRILTVLSLILVMACAIPANSQEKKFFTPEDASYNNRAVYAQRPNQLKWVGNTDILMKVKDNEIVTMNPNSKKETTFLTLDELNAYTLGEGVNELKRIPQLTWLNDFQAYFYALGENGITLSKMDIKKKTIEAVASIPQDAENQNICESNLNVAYTIGNNLYVAKGDKQIQITDNPEGVVAGHSGHRIFDGFGSGDALGDVDQRIVGHHALVHRVVGQL